MRKYAPAVFLGLGPGRKVLAIALLALLASHVSCEASAITGGRIEIVAVRGETAPDGSGEFFSFSEPSLNDSGQAAFLSWFGKTDAFGNQDNGAYVGDANALVRLARVSQPLAGGSQLFTFQLDVTVERMGDPALNSAGDVALRGLLGGGGNPDVAIVQTNGVQSTTIVRTGDAVPNGGAFASHFSSVVGLNDSGQVLFEAGALSGTSAGSANDSGIYRGDGAALVEIVREGDPVPNGGVFTNFDFVSLNEAGQASFQSDVGGASGSRGIYVGDGTAIFEIVRDGQSAPVGNGSLSFFSGGQLNDSGSVLFTAELDGTAGGPNDDSGLFLSDGPTILQLAREGQSIGGPQGTLAAFGVAALNNSGQALFSATVNSATPSDRGIFLADGTMLATVARKGQSAPTDGVFNFFREPAFNDAGQAAFYADLTQTVGGASDNFGLFMYDGAAGLVEVAREGDAFLGSVITELTFGPTFGFLGDERSGLNDLGQLAFRFRLADGREGIAIWSPIPEPAGLILLATALCAPIALRRQ